MGRRLSSPTGGVISLISPISEGGTSAKTPLEALTNLGIIPATARNSPNGVAALDADAKVSSVIEPPNVVGKTLDGSEVMYVNQVVTFQITNYDSNENYSISVNAGSVSRNKDIITYNVSSIQGTYAMMVNGKKYDLVVRPAIVDKPSILTPNNGATEIGMVVNLTATAFATIGLPDTHFNTTWQVATDASFTNIIAQTTSVVNKTSWSVSNLQNSTTYFVRVRYKGTDLSYSQWSEVTSFTTKASFVPNLEQAILTASDGVAGDDFGVQASVSSDGNTVAIGAYALNTNRGAVYIFTRLNGIWTQQQKIQPTDVASGDRFGWSCIISHDGQRIVAGSYSKATNTGAVYVFVRSGNTFTQEAKLVASDGASGDYFGYAVSISGNGSHVAVGAYGKATNTGAAYIFSRAGSTWTQQAKLVAGDAGINNYFGCDVGLSDDAVSLVIGAYGSTAMTGFAYVFVRSGSSWTQQQKLTASDGLAGDDFGSAVAISSDGNTIVIGAYLSDPTGNNSGAIYVFTRTDTVWTQQQKLTASDGVANDQFGFAVAISHNGLVIAVGSVFKATNKGAMYLFIKTDTGWVPKGSLMASNGISNDYLGNSVSLSEDGATALAAAYNRASGKGAVYVFV